ncbi:Cys-rich radical SAM target, FibroRumin family [Lachnospiraceae bacterium C10]|nr:Cys-rich radical SAM target, FibroRumin family [Lachnospiraceae bacterium C10]
MSATSVEYEKMFGEICDEANAMARCACVACNSCTCACSCRKTPGSEDIEW